MKKMHNNKIFFASCQKGYTIIVKLLITIGAHVNNVNNFGKTALILAVQNGHLEVVKALITAGANVNHVDQYGTTALMLAVQNGHLEVVKALITAGANVNHVDQHGTTALMLAAQNGHLEVVKALITAGANVNHVDQHGTTALMLAAQKYQATPVVKALITAGANVNHVDQHGTTALMLAAQNDCTSSFKALITAGANIEHANNCGKTVLTLAEWNGNTEIRRTLYQFIKIKKEITEEKIECHKEIISMFKSDYDILLQEEKRLINSLKILSNNLQKKLKDYANLSYLWKKDIINSFKFEKEYYSLLHMAVFCNMKNLVNYLVNEWEIDINYKDNSDNSAWNHACLLLKKETAFKIKHYSQLTNEDKLFLKQTRISLTNWTLIETSSNQIDRNVRNEIWDYYLVDDVVDYIDVFQKKVNDLDLHQHSTIENQLPTLKL